MDFMFWVWLGIMVGTFVLEIATSELVSIWFTIGAVVPLILSATGVISWEIQVLIFFLVSALLILSLRGVTKKFILKKATEKTNLDDLVGKKFRLLERTDSDTLGSIKVFGVIWGVVEENDQTIESGEIVEVVGVRGNKLVVKKAEEKAEEKKEENIKAEKVSKKEKEEEK